MIKEETGMCGVVVVISKLNLLHGYCHIHEHVIKIRPLYILKLSECV